MGEALGSLLPCLFLLIHLFIIFRFFIRLAGIRRRYPWQSLLFLASGCLLITLTRETLSLQPALIALLLLPYGIFAARAAVKTIALYALIAMETLVLCNGISDSAIGILAPFLYRPSLQSSGLLIMIIGGLLTTLLTLVCYGTILQFLSPAADRTFPALPRSHGAGPALLPLAMVFLANQYVHNTFYGNILSSEQLPVYVSAGHGRLLAARTLGILSVLGVVYIYLELNQYFSLRFGLSVLRQQCLFQQQYVEEARQRYEQAKGLRHDMRNHLLVIQNLLEQQRFEAAAAYVGEMENRSARTAFPFRTGHPVLDILLEDKAALAAAKEISIDSTLHIPTPCAVEDVDLCILLSNALDNAVSACGKTTPGRQKFIHISGRTQQDLLLLEIKNSCDQNLRFKMGTGLNNIRQTARRYGGAVNIQTENGIFCLDILLQLSPPQTHD